MNFGQQLHRFPYFIKTNVGERSGVVRLKVFGVRDQNVILNAVLLRNSDRYRMYV